MAPVPKTGPSLHAHLKNRRAKNTDSPRTLPPPRFCRRIRRNWCIALRAVMVTSSRHRSSWSSSCGNFPSFAPMQKLFMALSAMSSSSAMRRGAVASFFWAKRTSCP